MEIAILRAVQSFHTPLLDSLFQGVTMCGEQVVLILLFTAVYWSVDREFGESLGIAMLLSLLVNGALKGLVHAERPIGQPGVRSLRVHTAKGSSFPSGHTQSAATFYPFLAGLPALRARRFVRALLWLLPILVGFSRLYLGVHWPRDVAAGLLLGYALPLLAPPLLRRVQSRALICGAIALAFFPFLFFRAEHEFAAAYGCLTGFLAATAFERRYVRFSTDAVPIPARLVRWGAGLALLGALALALKSLLPAGNLFAAARYALLIFAGMGLWPLAFTRLERRSRRPR